MVRGRAVFKCKKCGHHFVALDVEWHATIMSAPVTCPKCGAQTQETSKIPVFLFEWFQNKNNK